MIRVKKIRPTFSSVLVTMDKYGKDEYNDGGITIAREGDLKFEQKVIAVGEFVKNISVGDLVYINISNYAKRKYEQDQIKEHLLHDEIVGYTIPTVTMDGEDYLLLQDRDILYIIEEFEEIDNSKIIKNSAGIIIPVGAKI